MVKSVSAALLSDIQSNVTTLATCLEIIRKDGQVLRLTTHDSDLTIAGEVYKHDVSFNLAAIQSGTQLQVDNTTLTLFADEVDIFLADFKAQLWEYAAITIFQVNYNNIGHGTVTMRKGWFGPINWSENHVVSITLTGLLKILDLEVGHIFQASCDADLGDSRCKVAIQQNQIRSELNPYHLGDWVYYYNTALMTALTVVNGGFETDGTRTSAQAITGWTKTAGAAFQVRANGGVFGTIAPVAGTYFLAGDTVLESPYESGLSQVIDVSAQIADNAAIDDGEISVAFFSALMVTEILTNAVRLKMELLDANDIILDIQDTRFEPFDAITVWRERACVMPLLPGTRKVRIWIYFLTGYAGLHGGNCADRVRMFWWDHTLGNPYSDVIHKVTRIGAFSTAATYKVYNPSFEFNHLVSNANNPTIAAWVTGAGNWWQIVTTAFAGALTSQDGIYFLLGGDDGGSTQRTYVISQVHPLTTALALQGWQLDAARILLGKVAGRFSFRVGYGDTLSAATVIIDWLNAADVVLETLTVLNAALGTVGWHTITSDFVIPPTATKVKVTLKARSPTGSGNAKVAYDDVKFIIYDAERPVTGDPRVGQGSASTVFDVTIGGYTFDNSALIFKAVAALTAYDLVDTVVNDRNEFTGTTMTGVVGDYVTGPLRFISGDNAGLRNIVRKWDPDTLTVKTYFRTPYPIQVGDRFYFAKQCQRRFIEDCVLRFENAINFRGFPYVPGAIENPNASFAPNPATITGSAAAAYTITPSGGAAGNLTFFTITATTPAFRGLTALKMGGGDLTVAAANDASLTAYGRNDTPPGVYSVVGYYSDGSQITFGTFTIT